MKTTATKKTIRPPKSAPRTDLVRYLDTLLDIDKIDERSCNGQQVEGCDTIRRAGLAVDGCLAAYEAAAAHGCQMVIVHHGMIWGGLTSLTGATFRQVKFLVENGLNLYAAHLPLDLHAVFGNNARLAAAVGIGRPLPFGVYHGIAIGFEGTLVRPLGLDPLCRALEKATGGATQTLAFGKKLNKRIAIVSGGASSIINEAIEKGIDCFITGEPDHTHFHLAKEAGLNVIYGGHYHSETPGVKAIGRLLEQKFGIESVFLDIPTSV